MTDLEEALKAIEASPQGIPQSDLWKVLNIDSRKCSRIVKQLLEKGLIDRIEYKKDGTKTFLLKAKRKKVANASLLLAGEELIPCIGCDQECVVEECPLLTDWMYRLAIEKEKSG